MLKNKIEIYIDSKDEDNYYYGIVTDLQDGKNKDYDHELLFDNNTKEIISIDYGWKIPNIEEMWNKIQSSITYMIDNNIKYLSDITS